MEEPGRRKGLEETSANKLQLTKRAVEKSKNRSHQRIISIKLILFGKRHEFMLGNWKKSKRNAKKVATNVTKH